MAALCVLALTATAMAVYQYTMKDTVIEDIPGLLDHTDSVTEISLVGFSDSPEYKAYVEWETWYRTWEAENSDWFNENGVDDSWHETPDNYVSYYGAYNQEQADKLDEITEKYGLSLHTDWQWGRKTTQLYAALDMDDFLGEKLTLSEFRIYEDGAFCAYCDTDITGTDTFVAMYVSVDGTFTDIGESMPDSYEEWSYTTTGGREVLMASSDDRSWMIANLDGCFVYARFQDVTDKTQAQTLVENIDLEALNTRFATESARRQAAQAVSDWVAQRQTATTTDNTADEAAISLQILGNYAITGLPEGSYLWSTTGSVKQEAQALNEYFGTDFWYECYSVTNYYEVPDIGQVYLYFRSLRDGETALEHDQTLEAMGEVQTDDTLNGYPAIVTTFNVGTDSPHYTIQWLDTDRELIFEVSGGNFPTLEEAKALAQAVTAVDPDLETGTAAYERRAAEHQEEIDALVDATLAQCQADEDAAAQELEYCLALMGDYAITAPLPAGITYDGVCADGTEDPVWDSQTNETVGHEISITQWYNYSDSSTAIHLAYHMCRDDQGQSVAQAYYDYWYNVRKTDAQAGYLPPLIDCKVGDYDAFITAYTGDGVSECEIQWLDTDRDLVFVLTAFDLDTWGVDDVQAQLIALAESVQ